MGSSQENQANRDFSVPVASERPGSLPNAVSSVLCLLCRFRIASIPPGPWQIGRHRWPGSGPGQLGPTVPGGHHLPDDDPLAAGHGRPATGVGRDPGGHGGHQRPAGRGSTTCGKRPGSRSGWSMPVTPEHLPGRPKTDTLDAVWLGKVAERQLLRPSFVPPPAIRQLRAPDPLPGRPGRGPPRPSGWSRLLGGRPDQTVGGGQRQLRGVGAGHAGRAGGRRARPKVLAQLAGPGCPPTSARWPRPSVGSSPTSTASCWPRCWPGWTGWIPTEPSSTPRSRS
jgi:hypothetical protein